MYTSIQLDKVRNFRYGMKAMASIEDQLGQSVTSLDLEKLTIRQTATIIWAGLVWEDKDLTVDALMDIVDEHSNMPAVLEAMTKAFSAGFGSAPGPNPKAVAPAARVKKPRSR